MTFLGLAALGGAVGVVYVMLVLRRPGTGLKWPVAGARSPRSETAAQPRPVSVQSVVDELTKVGDEETAFLDRVLGGFVTLSHELRTILESNEPIEDPVDYTKAELEGMRRRLRSNHLVPLPTKAETKEFLLRERFCEALPEGEAQEQMLKVLRGQTGFRSFEAAVDRLGLADSWRRYRDERFAAVAVEWLEQRGIPFESFDGFSKTSNV